MPYRHQWSMQMHACTSTCSLPRRTWQQWPYSRDEENGGWHCVDPTGRHQDMFSLKDLPADFVKTNKIEASDSGKQFISINILSN
jgi:hypothetical protein